MKNFHAILLREKFVLHNEASAAPVIALSNRMAVTLRTDDGTVQEVFIVRAQNMHTCIRMAARILQAHRSGGPLLSRPVAFDWNEAFLAATDDFEKTFNPACSVTVYSKGAIMFQHGAHNPFLDVIEQCAALRPEDYERGVTDAQALLKKEKKAVKTEYDGNVALNVDLGEQQGRVGAIFRSPSQTMIFNFSLAAPAGKSILSAQVLGTAAAFLEGIQLAFTVGMNKEKLKAKKIEPASPEAKHAHEGERRLDLLLSDINRLEENYKVNYRPERPEFRLILAEAERLTRNALAEV